jgi:hypothetical protein
MRRTFTFIYPIIIVFFCILEGSSLKGLCQGAPGKDPVAVELANRDVHTPILPKGVTKSWYNEAVAKIEDRELFIMATDKPGSFAAINHAQHLGYLISEKGYTVGNFNDDGSEKGIWRTHFIFEGIGRKDKLHAAPLRQVSQMGDFAVQYDHNDYAITYDNRRQGMEQSFIVTKRPAGHSDLQIALGLGGDLQAKMGKGDQLLLCGGGHPQDVKLAYDHFSVWDANRKVLNAHMRLTSAHRLVLTVDDRNAAYPLTVDPLNHLADLTINVNGILGTSVDETLNRVLAGYTVSGVSDVNGDGADELVIGAPLFTTVSGILTGIATLTGIVKGAAFVFYGVPLGPPSTTPSQILQPTALGGNSLFGFSLASADLDNDGKGDIIVGAPTEVSPFNTLARVGNVYIYLGNSLTADVNVIPAASKEISYGTSAFDVLLLSSDILFGFSVANGGRINNDGIDDLIIGTPGYALGSGRVDIYHGLGNATVVNATPSSTILGNIGTSLFGYSVSSAGSVNNDVFDDIVVGAPGLLATPSAFAGKAYIYHSSATAAGITATSASGANTVLTPPSPGLITSLYGFSVSSGDFNNDGKGDVIVGEPLFINLNGANGRAHIYYGTNSAAGVTTATHTILSSNRPTAGNNLLFGYSVAGGDVNGDGIDDALIGEPGGASLSALAGASLLGLGLTGSVNIPNGQAYVFKGVNAPAGIVTGAAPVFTFTNTSGLSIDLIGSSVKGGYDLNADGFDDLIIGAPSGTLDLGLSLSALPSALATTLQIGSGMVPSNQIGNVQLFFGNTGPLPVTLLTFTAAPVNGDALLNWSTAQEQNSDHFGIEHSTDGIHFTSLGQVASAHNSSVKNAYTYTDGSPASGNNYYRLKMMDLDGQFAYSKVAVVSFQAGGPASMAVYPNPARGAFNLVFRNMAPGTYRMSLVSVAGQAVMTKNIVVSNRIQHKESVILPVIVPGSYWIRLIDSQNHSYLSRLEVR